MAESAHHHRPTLKQQNKRFKSKHASKGILKDRSKGRILQTPKAGPKSTAAAAQTRLNRKNNAKQIQLQKRNAIMSGTRLFNGVDGCPRIVVVVPLSPDISSSQIVESISSSLDVSAADCMEDGLWKLRADRFKTSLQFRTLPYRNFYATLDACKVADYVVFALSSQVEVDTWGDTLLRSLQSQGLPEVITVLAPGQNTDPKLRTSIMKSLLSFMQYFVPAQQRIFDLDAVSDRLSALRGLAEGRPSDIGWRDGRSWLLSEQVEWENGSLKVTGVVRGSSLSPNRLVHLPNYGDYQISKIYTAPLPRTRVNATGMEVEATLVGEPNTDDADSLVSTNAPDDLQNEQTWPTEEEMNDSNMGVIETNVPDAAPGTTPKSVRRIPKGMSEYQAAWIIDEEDEEEGDTSDKDADQMADEEQEEMVDVEEPVEMDTDNQKGVHFQDLDIEEEHAQLEHWRNRKREEEDELNFPDEVDTPQDVPAHTRFARYRGMRSFRTSPWDPYENLPRDYARIFQFEDFKRTERSVRKRAQEETVVAAPGTRVTVYLANGPQEAVSHAPLTLFSLLQHEHKSTVLNFTVQRNTEFHGSVRSKDPLILCVGPRRLQVNPIYSQHTRGGGKGTNNVHKFERYLRPSSTSVATVYGPVTYGNQSCTLLKQLNDSQAPQLVAYGSFLNTDTTRVIAKRIVLSGHPFRVHKKIATIRYMFFNPDDIQYFKPIQLHTKHGRVGHIKESLGTHGYFKAYFDGPINQMDTICMSLYKRVYPKWAQPFQESIESTKGHQQATFDEAMEE
ncbi:ribosome biogenesis protein tsr1 [Coprinopsis marcescibilis]|uniref:Ribosome biogenesis protein tsr1 n=1 Tax=Coprinopsis marcescibilis TaxID=230819 RepID=A0A5C3LA94_COPMA|nr:ribosome biogenesis protein tsr1 [Coprinopsis marcescibilis]